MKEQENIEVNKDEIIGGGQQELPMLPDGEYLRATITNVDYRVKSFMGKPCQRLMLVDGKPEPIKDRDGNPTYYREFNITFELDDYILPSGDKRKTWLGLTASMKENSKLHTFLMNVAGFIPDDRKASSVISLLNSKQVLLQVKNRKRTDGKTRQLVAFDMVKAR